jgi:integrase
LERVADANLSRGAECKYRQVARMFLSVVEPMREISTVTPSDIRAYERLLEHYKPSSKAGMLVKLKTLLRRPMQEGLLTSDPFRDTKITKPAPIITYLTEEELERMRNREFGIDRLSKVRDVAIFQASCGLSYSDLRSLRAEDVVCKDGVYYISKARNKTGVDYVAPIIDGGEKIFFRYMGRLPLLSGQKQNAYLKEIQDLCAITGKNLSTHIFRRTYATRLMNAGVRVTTIARALGHTQPTMTLRHYASIQPDTILSEVREAFK